MTLDVLIVGGGIIGLSIAIELKLLGASPTIISRDFKSAATLASAGMLAPDAEQISDPAMQQLCWQSRSLYREWTCKLENLTGLNTGYWSCGVLAPVYNLENNLPPSCDLNSHNRYWLDGEVIHKCQSGLGKDIIGGWWYPEDGQVDSRALGKTLLSAVQSLGIEVKEGIGAEAILEEQCRVVGVQTKTGLLQANHYVIATGAWANELFPLPVKPKKGQMLQVRVTENISSLPLNRILFMGNTYIVPRKDGRIIIGASSEDVGFTPHNTPVEIQELLALGISLYPQLQDYPLEDFWSGFRPVTPDELPILGSSYCHNLTFATGHYRNGILLAPITSRLIADLICKQKSDPLLDNFHYSRFQTLSPKISSVLTSTKNSNPLLSIVNNTHQTSITDTPLVIAGKVFSSRLMTGTGKYRCIEEMQKCVNKSGCQIVTVAVRRVQNNVPGHESLAEVLDWEKIWMLPNTAGCKTAEEAIRVAFLGREMAKLLGQEDNNFVKLEVIPDSKYLLPDPFGTLEAAEKLVKEGFAVLPYINADPMLAKRLEEVGCATVMPLASPIGSGQGLQTAINLQIIIENAKIPVVVDAGIGSPSEAAQVMEMGSDALLVNSAIALSDNPPAMAYAMNLATVAGRMAYSAGRMPMRSYASASSPLTGTID